MGCSRTGLADDLFLEAVRAVVAEGVVPMSRLGGRQLRKT